MTVAEKVYSVLSGNAGVIALVPAARIKVPGDWQDLPLPYVVHFPVSANPTHTMSERATLTEWSFYQVSIFAASYSACDAIATAIKAVIGHANVDGVQFAWTGQTTMPFEEDVRVQQIVLNFSIWEGL